jgi:hypothetical protein
MTQKEDQKMTKIEATEMMIKNLSTEFDPNLFETCYTKTDVIEAVASFAREGFDETLENAKEKIDTSYISEDDGMTYEEELNYDRDTVIAAYRNALIAEGKRQISRR